MIKRGVILGGVLTLFSGVILCNNSYASAEFSIDVSAAALQLTVPENVNIVLQPTSSAAVFDSRNLTFNVATNNPTGYVVTMSVPQTAMPHSSLASITLPTLDSSTTEANFPANKWGYKTTGNYTPVALTNTDPAWNGEGATNGTDHIVTLAAKVDGSQPAGIYTNTLTFNAVANPNLPKDTIVFNANDVNATGSMTNQTVYQGSSITLNQNSFILDGYEFAGWNTESNGTGTSYANGGIYTPDVNIPTTKTVTLYAQWESLPPVGSVNRAFLDEGKPKTTIDGNKYYSMQDMSAGICDLIDEEQRGQVLDSRDNTVYNIGKMADGNCWLLDNLKLDLTIAEVKSALDSTNTNASDESIGYLLNGGGTSSDNYATKGITEWAYPQTQYDKPKTYVTGKNSTYSSDTLEAARGWQYGVLYNYCAASAGTYCFGSGETQSGTSSGNATEDICPFGWRLPSNNELTQLVSAYVGADNMNQVHSYLTLVRTTLKVSFPGWTGGTNNVQERGTSSTFWSSTRSSNSNMYNLSISKNGVYPSNATIRYGGRSVRCIAK